MLITSSISMSTQREYPPSLLPKKEIVLVHDNLRATESWTSHFDSGGRFEQSRIGTCFFCCGKAGRFACDGVAALFLFFCCFD